MATDRRVATVSLRPRGGEWMVSVPGTAQMQHFIPVLAETRPYALSHAYVAPCANHPLCIPADANYRRGIPGCPACMRQNP